MLVFLFILQERPVLFKMADLQSGDSDVEAESLYTDVLEGRLSEMDDFETETSKMYASAAAEGVNTDRDVNDDDEDDDDANVLLERRHSGNTVFSPILSVNISIL